MIGRSNDGAGGAHAGWRRPEFCDGQSRAEQVARTADFAVRVFSVAIIATVRRILSRRRNSGVLFFPIDISLSSCACSGGEGNSPSLISPYWREPSTERGHCAFFT